MSSRTIRDFGTDCESSPESVTELEPFWTPEEDGYNNTTDLELGGGAEPAWNQAKAHGFRNSAHEEILHSDETLHRISFPSYAQSKWTWRWRLCELLNPDPRRRRGSHSSQRSACTDSVYLQNSKRLRRGLRAILRLLTISFMLLGVFQFLLLVSGLFAAFFPDEIDWSIEDWKDSKKEGNDLYHWPTDFSAEIVPVACHSHNDYFRKRPLFSALAVGCTSVEADVFLYDDELYVGHSTAGLTPSRTLRSLYIDPLLRILDLQNPITSFHKELDLPRNGVFDTKPSQSLVLLIDFKLNGEETWPIVDAQLDPFREKKYLTYYNGSQIIEGPITVVVTGNAPFDRVVAKKGYRDMFFDAPLDLMVQAAPIQPTTYTKAEAYDRQINRTEFDMPSSSASTSSSSSDIRSSTFTTILPKSQDRGQGHSGSAPTDAQVYSPANSYFASVDFQRSILQSIIPIPLPGRIRLSRSQMDLIRRQIAGAHARGLKVRYWNVPSWPHGWRHYFWRILVREGIDYLNVDDLKDATSGDWGMKRRYSNHHRESVGMRIRNWKRSQWAESAWWIWL